MELKTISFKDLMAILRKASALRFSHYNQRKSAKKSVVIHSLYGSESGSEDGFIFDFCDNEYVFCCEWNHQLEMIDNSFLVKSLCGTKFFITPLFSRTLEELLKEIESEESEG